MPTGHSSDHDLERPDPARSTAPSRAAGLRARPGCTRYQWPSSIASVIDPEERRADQHARHRQQRRVAGGDAGGDQSGHPDDRRDQVEHRRELGHAGVGPVGAPVDAGHRRHPGRRAARPAPAPPPRPALRRTTDTPSATLAGHHDGERRRLAHRHRVEPHADRERAGGHQDVDAAHQPAVADADLAAAGGDPQEQQPADRPLQQHGGGVEADHGERG